MILGFVASAPSVVSGHGLALTAYFIGGTGEVDPGVGEVQSGVATSVSPTDSTTYTLTVTGPGGAATASVDVAVVEGASLTVTLDGALPSAPSVTLFGPMGRVAVLTSTQTLSSLVPGDYDVSAASVAEAGVTFLPSVSASRLTLAAGGTSSVEVTYDRSDAAPSVSPIADQVFAEGSSPVISFTVGDGPNPLATLDVSASSSAPAFLPQASLTVGGAGANRTLTIAAPGIAGSATVSIVAGDPFGRVAVRSFQLTTLPAAVVTTASDSGPGSLREVMSAASSRTLVTFDPSVTGPIVLTSGPIAVSGALFVQGPGARVLSVTGDGASGIFTVGAGASLAVSGLTLTQANQAIQVAAGGTLHVADCAFTDNSAVTGAAISNQGAATVDRSLFSGNVSDCVGGCGAGGGAVLSFGGGEALPSFTARDSTFTANVAKPSGGAFGSAVEVSAGSVTLSGCTVTGNLCQGPNCFGGAVGISGVPADPLHPPPAIVFDLGRNIIAGNVGGTTPDVIVGSVQPVSVNDLGDNVLGSVSGLTPVASDVAAVTDPALSALGDHGGPTDTLVPLPASPALDVVSLADLDGDLVDQRGAARRADVAEGTARSDSGATDRQPGDPAQ